VVWVTTELVVFGVAVLTGLVLGGFGVVLAIAAKQGDQYPGPTAYRCEHPGCQYPWTVVLDLDSGPRWVCDQHVQNAVDVQIGTPFETFGVRERSRA
jgi:hypothetical protein